MNKKLVLTELLHIDAPIAVAQLTYLGEALENPPWSKNRFDIKPYCVFHRHNGVIYYIYDQIGLDWKMKNAGMYEVGKLRTEILRRWSKVRPTIKEEKVLNISELKVFIEDIKQFWPWLECMWWLIEDLEKRGLDVSEAMKIRKETEYFSPGLIAVIRKSFKKILGDNEKYADVVLIEELLSGHIPTGNVLEKRMVECVYVDGKLLNSLDEAKVIYNFEVKEEEINNLTELKGQIAYAGKVTGRVKIVKTRDDMKKFQKGDVIVSPTTTPDFLSIMKISSAIISEHGGVICHAAITSRELKIPCIVGVKAATKVLKDGDLVEVDANNGVVRIVS